jgi:membrane-bound lytic murein transglycosylase D
MIPTKIIIILFLTVLLSPWFPGSGAVQASVDPFPVHDSIRANVRFWKKVYTEHPSTVGYIHDSRNLDIIYEVMELMDPQKPEAKRINNKRVRMAKLRYRRILDKLARGEKADTGEEKRILALFASQAAKKSLAEAKNNIRFQRCLRDRFLAGLERSGAYFEEMRKIFTELGLPADLAYLPHVESSFNYKARSKYGAVGVWQFTRGTGRKFMTVNNTLDERRDPILATHAAARLLKENHEKLESWPLALTAYNYGVNGMLRAKKAQGNYEKIFNKYGEGRFGFASRNFYAEFIAARDVALHYRHFFGEVNFETPIKTHELKLPSYIDIKELSRYFKVDTCSFRQLNPALGEVVFSGQRFVPKGYLFRLPYQMHDNFDRLAGSLSKEMFHKNQKRDRFYLVNPGDTAGTIARRNGLKLTDLILANNLDSRATVYAGQTLKLPVFSRKNNPVSGLAGKMNILAGTAKQAPMTPRPKSKN